MNGIGRAVRIAAATVALIACLAPLASLVAQAPAAQPQRQPPKQPPVGPLSPDLKSAISLQWSDANGNVAVPLPPGSPLVLVLSVKQAIANETAAMLSTSAFKTQDSPPFVTAARLKIDAKDGSTPPEPSSTLPVDLSRPHSVAVEFTFDRRPAGKVFVGDLVLTTATKGAYPWHVTVTVGAKGTLAASPIAPLRFVSWPSWLGWLPWKASDDCSDNGLFSFSIADKSDVSTYNNLRVTFEPSTAANAKTPPSNLTIDNFSFWSADPARSGVCSPNGLQRVDLDRTRRGAVPNASAPDLVVKTVRRLTAQVAGLEPGEYTGTLSFGADEAADEAKLSLTIDVRHPRTLAVLVILLGSCVGWFTSKYVVGRKKGRDLARAVGLLRGRANYLARPTLPRAGWQFPKESGSLALVRVRVTLHQLAMFAQRALPMLTREDEIQQMRKDADVLLAAIERLHDARMAVESIADGRPAAQRSIGRLLGKAIGILEKPQFGDAEQKMLADLLAAVDAWTSADLVTPYRSAVLSRRQSSECPTQAQVDAVPASVMHDQLDALVKAAPAEAAITGQGDTAALNGSDVAIAKLALLWREYSQQMQWADDLAAEIAGGKSLTELFQFVDERLWQQMKDAAAAGQFVIEREATRDERPRTFEILEMRLAAHVPNLSTTRILYHPLRVEWTVVPPDKRVRLTETEGLTLVQYVSTFGTATVEAALRWQGQEIPIKSRLTIEVDPNLEYSAARLFMDWPEYAAIAVAAAFAVMTALLGQYDSTFGSVNQYISLFLWAAGAGTGGNLFNQLGTSSAPGGRTDTALVRT